VIRLHSGESEWVRGLGRGLSWAAMIALAAAFLRAVTRAGGLGEVHFRWPGRSMHRLRKAFSAIVAVYLPSLLILSTTIYDPSSRNFDSLGRVFFILSHLWIGFILARTLYHPEITSPGATRKPVVLRTASLCRLLVVIIPFALVVLAAIGYLNTSIVLSFVFTGTLAIASLGILLYALILRWFMIKERRLNAEKMLAERLARRELAKAADHTEEASDAAPVAADDIELDLDAIGGQIRQLLGSLILVGVVLSIWWYWSSALHLGGKSARFSVGEGITLLSLLESALIIWVGSIVVRNLPGLLELAGLRDSTMDSGTRHAVVTIIQYAATIIVAFIALQMVDLDWSKFGWIAAALSVGLGFGLQEVVANFVCGIILLFERPIRVGDVVVLDGVSGRVARIRMRATTITNWDREDLVVPNKQLITGSLINCTLGSPINRVMIPVGISYGSDVSAAIRILGEVAADNHHVLADPAPFTSFEEFGDSSLGLVLRCYLPDRDNRLRAITELHREINRRFKQANIEIPFPQRDLHIKSQPEDAATS
jgi:potassium efflux system protein